MENVHVRQESYVSVPENVNQSAGRMGRHSIINVGPSVSK
jgi:hypothetical protein